MSVSIDKYVDLLSRYALYGEDGYYVDPHIVHRIIVDELKLSMSFEEIETFIKTCEISSADKERKLKERCITFFEILEDLAKIKTETISKEGWNRINEMGIHINEYGNIYITDVVRFADEIIDSIKALYNKISQGSNLKASLPFQESRHDFIKEDKKMDLNKKDMIPRTIIFSHESDIDGMGSIVLGKLAFPNLDYVLLSNIESLEKTFREYLTTGKLNEYDQIYITDLALYDPSLTMVANSSLKERIHIFDHHKSAINENMNRYPFTQIVEENETGKKCGTQLFFDYLQENQFLPANKATQEFVELTRLEDTWEWKRVPNLGVQAHDLAILFQVIGVERYLNTMTLKLLKNPNSFSLTFEEEALVQKKKEEYHHLLQGILSTAEYFIDKNGNRFGIVYANYEYRNELAELIKQGGNSNQISYLIVVAMDKGKFGQKSYRSIIESFDVNEIATFYGGGGHPSAASVSITQEQKNMALTLKKKEGLKYLSECSYSNE